MLTKNEILFDGKLMIDVPADFFQIQEENFKKYYKNSKPGIVFANEEKGATLAISDLGQKIAKTDIEKRTREYVVAYQRSVPNFSNCKVAMRNINETDSLGIFCFTSTSIEKDLFNYVVLGCLCGREILITMCCDVKDGLIYIEKFIRTINSIAFKDGFTDNELT